MPWLSAPQSCPSSYRTASAAASPQSEARHGQQPSDRVATSMRSGHAPPHDPHLRTQNGNQSSPCAPQTLLDLAPAPFHFLLLSSLLTQHQPSVSWWHVELVRHAPASSRPLYLLFPQPGMLFPQVITCPSPSPSPGLYTNSASGGGLSWPPL